MLRRRSDGLVEVWKGGRQIGNPLLSLAEASSFAKSDKSAAEDSDRGANQNGTKGDSQNASQPESDGDEPDASQSFPSAGGAGRCLVERQSVMCRQFKRDPFHLFFGQPVAVRPIVDFVNQPPQCRDVVVFRFEAAN